MRSSQARGWLHILDNTRGNADHRLTRSTAGRCSVVFGAGGANANQGALLSYSEFEVLLYVCPPALALPPPPDVCETQTAPELLALADGDFW
jgi:hypothetical protein